MHRRAPIHVLTVQLVHSVQEPQKTARFVKRVMNVQIQEMVKHNVQQVLMHQRVPIHVTTVQLELTVQEPHRTVQLVKLVTSVTLQGMENRNVRPEPTLRRALMHA